ncbi:nadh:ubiquinone oxidoreductase subunit [Fusarium sp. NRRL 52700]|nr:nadh:ubiquinone oxidoreductase subunit [Fusarium sp. NRRL 52700]
MAHLNVKPDPAYLKYAAMMKTRHHYFRWTPRTARLTFIYVAVVPSIMGYIAYKTDVTLGVRYHHPLPLDRPPELSGNLSPLLQSPIGKSPPASSLQPARPPLKFLRPEPPSRPPRTTTQYNAAEVLNPVLGGSICDCGGIPKVWKYQLEYETTSHRW